MTAEPADEAANIRVPEPIRAMGPRAIDVYRRLFADSNWARSTKSNYKNCLSLFFRWAEDLGLTPESITPAHITAFREERAARLSYPHADMILPPVRALFRQLQAAGLIANDSDRSFGESRAKPKKLHEEGQPPLLLSVMAMLTYLEEGSLHYMLSEDAAAVMLLEFLRWPEGRRCPHCGAEDESPLLTGRYRCGACGGAYWAASGTLFDDGTLSLSSAFSVLHAAFLAAEPPPAEEEWASARGLDPAAVASLMSRIRRWLDGQGLTDRASLDRALKEEDVRLAEQQITRKMVHAGELMGVRDELQKSQAAGQLHPDLPPGMTNEEALATIQAKLDEVDRHVIYLEDGRLARRLATAEELADRASTAADEPATEGNDVA